MKRRSFIQSMPLAAAAGGLSPGRRRFVRPNILWIMTDQQPADYMSCTGNPWLKTPAMDSLAAEGTRFELAYCATPLCVPSRSAIYCGTTAHEANAAINRHPEFESYQGPMLAQMLEDNGYRCGLIGKWHLQVPPDHCPRHGFSFLGLCSHNGQDEKVPAEVARFLAMPQERPFFLVASLVNPHDVCEWARGQTLPNGEIGPAPPAAACPPLPSNFEIPPGEPGVLRDIQRRQPKVYPSVDWKTEKWRQYRWAGMRMTEKVDALVGRILQSLALSPYADNTVVMFTSDHGDGSAHHRWNQKQVLYEECTRVPLIIHDPRVSSGRVDATHLVQTGTDLFATVCDYAGVEQPEGCRGASLRPLLAGGSTLWRDHLVVETEFCGWGKSLGITGRAVRDERYKYIVYSEGAKRDQLFDLLNDPGETQDLSGSASLAAVRRRLRLRLQEWIENTGDDFKLMVG